MQPYPPLGSLYSASVVQQLGCDVHFHDAMLSESLDDWRRFLDTTKPDVVVLQEDNFNYLSKMCLGRMREAAAEMIGFAKEQNATIVVGGADVTDDANYYLQTGAHYAMLGEGEQTLTDIIEAIAAENSETIPALPGVATLSNQLLVGDRRPVIKNPDELGLPAWDLIDLEQYRSIWRKHHGYYSVNMVTTRGCPYKCNWCAKPIWGRGYKSRSPQDVVTEMEFLQERIAPDHIWFMDDIFGLKPRWLEEFAEITKQRNIRIPYKCLSRADLLLRPGEVDHLAASGCACVWLGAESGSQKILDAMDKGTTVKEIIDARNLLSAAGIDTGFFIQFGYPGERMPEIRDTINLVRRALPDDMGVSVSYPLPGPKFYETVKDQLRSKRNWHDSDDLAMLFDGPFPTYFYRWLHRLIHVDLNLHKTWQLVRGDANGHLKPVLKVLILGGKWLWYRGGLILLASIASLGKPSPQRTA